MADDEQHRRGPSREAQEPEASAEEAAEEHWRREPAPSEPAAEETPAEEAAEAPPRSPPRRGGARRRGRSGRGRPPAEEAAAAPREPASDARRRGRAEAARRRRCRRDAPAAEARPKKRGRKRTTRSRRRSSRAPTSSPTSCSRRSAGAEGDSTPTPYAEDGEAAGRGDAAEAAEAEPQPVAHEPLDLAADARYIATGKRKSAVARVILQPGEGSYTINGRHLDQFFPRVKLQRMAQQPLETAGYDSRMDVVAKIHGGGVSSQAGALRHGIARALVEADPQPSRRAQAPRLPHARPAREGAQEGRPQEGPQAAAVLQALARRWRQAAKLFGTDGVRGVAGEFLTAELALALGPRPPRPPRRPTPRRC